MRFGLMLSLGLLVCWSTVGFAATEAAPPTMVQQVDQYLRPYLDIGHLSGRVLIAKQGEVLYDKSFGLADHEHLVSNSAGTKYCIGSITKPMTIVILARLVEMEKLALSDKLSKFLPEFPNGDAITVDDLLNHRSGIPHRVTETLDEVRPQSPASVAALAAEKPLVFEPGSDSVYSSAGFSVLARVLELAGGKPYAELLAEHVLVPAGMLDSSDAGTIAIMPNRASSYVFDTDGLLNKAPEDISYLVGAGSVYSTAGDLLAMQQALVAGKLGQRAQEWLIRDNGNVVWNGLAYGFRAFADYDAAGGITVVVTSNLVSGALDRIREALPKIAAGETVETPKPIDARAVDVEPGRLLLYEGSYQLRPGRNLELRVVDGRVRMNDWLLIPTSETTLFSPQDYAVIEVVLDDNGTVSRLDWTAGGKTYPMPKVDD